MQKRQPSPWTRYAFGFLLFITALTGFAQMPIFKRYYIADIPGLGWLADFYTTHVLHYLGAIALMALGAYLLGGYLLLQRRFQRVSTTGYLRGGLLLLIIATGILLVLKNYPGYRYAPGLIVALDLAHIGLVMLFIMAVLAALIFKQRWLAAVPAETTDRANRHRA